MTYLEYKKRLEFGRKEYDYINQYCREKPIDWTASVWDLDSLEFIKKYNPPFLKIPSAHLTNHKLLKAAAKTGIPIIASTGMSTLKEIDDAVAILKRYSSQFALLHCNSSYPAQVSELNLKMIPQLAKRYKCVIGYSGHEFGLPSTTMAVVLGAKIVERHITLDHSMWGTDQLASVEPQGMDKFYKQVADASLCLGDGKKRIYEAELAIKKKLRDR
jgi:N-acetylneuraminate synthase